MPKNIYRMIGIVCLFSFALFSQVIVHAQEARDERVARIQKAYEGIVDIKGSFVQKNQIKDLKRTDTYKGQFFIRPPKMKWDYSGDKAQTIYVNADTLYIHQKKLNQVIKQKFDRATYGQAPIALLAGFGDIAKDFDVLPSSGERIVLKPKKSMGNVTQIEIQPSQGAFPIAGLVIVDSLGNRIDIAFQDVKTNTGIKPQVFDFKPPKGATVLEP